MIKSIIGFCAFGALMVAIGIVAVAQANDDAVIKAKKSADFEINGLGTASNWSAAEWIVIPQRTSRGNKYSTKAKVLYSDTGIYFLFDCEDKKLSATMNADFMDLWKEDVVEVFLWTDPSDPFYFEYELSPLNYELPILISNHNMDLARWMPFHYEENRKTRRATSVRGGKMEPHAQIEGWMAEFYIPYQLLRPLKNIFPKSGTEWRINLYRVDYDSGNSEAWAWQMTGGSFHRIEHFGRLVFE
jgi:hypothetical protein